VPFGVSTRDSETFFAVLARNGLRAAYFTSSRSAGYEAGVSALSVLVEYVNSAWSPAAGVGWVG
jgi:hypothetical protein